MTSAMRPPGDDRLLPIDGLRGIAVLLVMQYHFWGLPFGLFNREPTLAIDRHVADVVQVGWAGVDLFFVLSGFLITGILLDVKGRGGYFRTFYARRGLRIIPPYYAFLIFAMFIIPLVPAWDDGLAVVAEPERLRDAQIWFWAFALNIYVGFDAFSGDYPFVYSHFWTLAVEEQFYLVWPFVVLAVRRADLAWACLVAVVGAFLFRIALTEGAWDSIFTKNAISLMPAKMDALALGAFVAVAVREGYLARLATYAPFAIGAAAVALIALYARNSGLHQPDIETIQFGYIAFGMLFASIVVLALTARAGSPFHAVLTTPVLLSVGKYSYMMYIVHTLVGWELSRQVAVNDWWRTVAESQIPFNIIFSAVATAICYAIAWVSWRVFEGPVLSLKRHFTYRERQAEVPPSGTQAGVAGHARAGGAD